MNLPFLAKSISRSFCRLKIAQLKHMLIVILLLLLNDNNSILTKCCTSSFRMVQPNLLIPALSCAKR